jgi:hypothetical protein
MAVLPYQIKVKCNICSGDGIVESINGNVPCVPCSGTGWLFHSQVEGAEQIDALTTKVDTLQTDVTKCLRRLKKIMDKLEVVDD